MVVDRTDWRTSQSSACNRLTQEGAPLRPCNVFEANVIIPASSEVESELGRSDEASRLFPSGHLLPFALVTALFFIWGMSNNLTDILVQQFKKSFELSAFQAQLVQTAVFSGYFLMALPAALGMRRWGNKSGLLIGLCIFGSGTLLFWPAAIIGRYWLMLTALFIVGCGSAALETAANPFIAQFGPSSTSERRFNFTQAFNPPGTITGVLIGTFFIFSGVELPLAKIEQMKSIGIYQSYLHQELMRVVPTYVALGTIVLLLALIISRVRFPATTPESSRTEQGSLISQLGSLLRLRDLRYAIVAHFFYCGAQVGTWPAFIPYIKQYTATSERAAALFLLGNLIAFASGRILSTLAMRWIRPITLMSAYASICILLVGIGIVYPGLVGAGAILLTSFFMSIMYPTIFAVGVKGLGSRTKLASSSIVMSVVGVGMLPPLLGFIAKRFDSYALGYSAVAACYVIVAAFAFRVQRSTQARIESLSHPQSS